MHTAEYISTTRTSRNARHFNPRVASAFNPVIFNQFATYFFKRALPDYLQQW